MPRPLPAGLYERLVSRGLDRELRELHPERFDVHKERPAPSELPRLLAATSTASCSASSSPRAATRKPRADSPSAGRSSRS